MLLSLLTGPSPCPCCAYAHAASVMSFARPQADNAASHLTRIKATAAPARLSPALRIDNATVVDPRDGSKSAGMSILMNMGRITDVFVSGSKAVDPATQAIDGSGRFVVPGYNDMHSHALELADPSGSLALMLAEGVTGFRQMSGSASMLAQRLAGTLPIGDAAPALHETPGSVLTPFNAGTGEAVIAEINRQQRQGADFIKVGLLNPNVFLVALEECRRVGIPLLGHLQEGTDALDATAAGFRSIEHLGPGSTVWISCSNDEVELRADSYRRDLIKAPPFKVPFLERIVMKKLAKLLINPSAFARPKDVARLSRAIGSFNPDKGAEVAAKFAADGSWQVPTLVRLRTQEYADRPEYEQDEMLQFMPRRAVKQWREVTDRYKKLPGEMLTAFREAYPQQQSLAKLFSDAGVRMMVGTDGGSFLGPGMTLKQEFKELSDAGISSSDILKMATVNAADYLGKSETMGLVESGKDADLVLLERDPLERVENLHSITGVVRAGFHYTRQQLDAMKSQVARTRGSLH